MLDGQSKTMWYRALQAAAQSAAPGKAEAKAAAAAAGPGPLSTAASKVALKPGIRVIAKPKRPAEAPPDNGSTAKQQRSDSANGPSSAAAPLQAAPSAALLGLGAYGSDSGASGDSD